jgi:uncharacterized protein YjiS (DUF1127 family)
MDQSIRSKKGAKKCLAAQRMESKMTLIAIEGRDQGSYPKFTDRLTTVWVRLLERHRRWRQFRRTVSELRQYADDELLELGISRYDIEDVARAENTAVENLSSSHPMRRT